MIFTTPSVRERIENIEMHVKDIASKVEGFPLEIQAAELVAAFELCARSFEEMKEDVDANIARL